MQIGLPIWNLASEKSQERMKHIRNIYLLYIILLKYSQKTSGKNSIILLIVVAAGWMCSVARDRKLF